MGGSNVLGGLVSLHAVPGISKFEVVVGMVIIRLSDPPNWNGLVENMQMNGVAEQES